MGLPGRQESLDPLAGENFTGISGAFRVHRFHVQSEELAAILAHAAYVPKNFAVLAIEEPDTVVGDIGDIEEPLVVIRREPPRANFPAA